MSYHRILPFVSSLHVLWALKRSKILNDSLTIVCWLDRWNHLHKKLYNRQQPRRKFRPFHPFFHGHLDQIQSCLCIVSSLFLASMTLHTGPEWILHVSFIHDIFHLNARALKQIIGCIAIFIMFVIYKSNSATLFQIPYRLE